MKSLFVILFCISCAFINYAYAQSKKDSIRVGSIESAIDHTLINFRQKVHENSLFYCILKNQLSMPQLRLDEKSFLIDQRLDAKQIKKNEKQYLLTFSITQVRAGLIVDVTISLIRKKSSNKIELSVADFDIPRTYKVILND